MVSYSSLDRYDIVKPHADLLAKIALVSSFRYHMILIDIGSSIDILFWDMLQRMGISKDRLRLVSTSLVGLTVNKVSPLGTIYLTLMLGEEPKCIRVDANWLVVDCELACDCILRRPSLVTFRAAIPSYQLMLKFPMEEGNAEVKGDQLATKRMLCGVVERVSSQYC